MYDYECDTKDYLYLVMIPYGRQDIQESDISAIIEVLKSDFLTQGLLCQILSIVSYLIVGLGTR